METEKQTKPKKLCRKNKGFLLILVALVLVVLLGVLIALKTVWKPLEVDYSKEDLGVEIDAKTITEYTGNNLSVNDSEDVERGTMLAEYQMIAEEMSLDTLDTLVDCDYEQLSNEDKTAIADAISEAVTDKKQPGLEADDCKSLQKDGQTIELNLETETPELTSNEIYNKILENSTFQISFTGNNYVTKGDNVFDVYLVATMPALDENLEPELLAYSKGKSITQEEFESLYTRNVSEFPKVEKVIEATVVKCDDGTFKLAENPIELLGAAGSNEGAIDYTDVSSYNYVEDNNFTYNLAEYYTTDRIAESTDALVEQYKDSEFNFLDSTVYLNYYNEFANITVYKFEVKDGEEIVDYIRYVRYNDLVLNGDDVVVVQRTEKCSIFDEEAYFERFISRLNNVIPNLIHY